MKSWVATMLSATFAVGCADETPETSHSSAPPVVERAPAQEPIPAPSTPLPVEPPPLRGAHLDGDDTGYRPRDTKTASRDGKTIELFLRSTPAGATASVDGKPIGVTPTFWAGIADDEHHEFTFVKDGFAMARYRFVARQNGIVHGTLKPLAAAPAGNRQAAPAASPTTSTQ